NAPVVDGMTLPRDPFDPDAPPLSADIPFLIGSTETEVAFFPNLEIDPISETRLLERVRLATGCSYTEAVNLVKVYRDGRPDAAEIDLALIVESDVSFREGVLTEAVRKAAQPAPVYMYYFTWRSPVHDGKLKSFHTLDI